MLSVTPAPAIFLHTDATDMRKSFTGLCGLIRGVFGDDPADGSLVLFVNKRRDRIKALWWDGDGFVLWYKRLEQGTLRWTPIFGRPDKVEFPGWEAPYQEQDDGWEATSVWTGFQGESGLSGRQRGPHDRPTCEPVWDPHEPSDGLEETAHVPGGGAVCRWATATA